MCRTLATNLKKLPCTLLNLSRKISMRYRYEITENINRNTYTFFTIGYSK